MELIREINTDIKFKNAETVYKYLEEFKNEDREYFIAIGLDSSGKPMYREVVYIGTLNACPIHPREVFKKAIMMSANSIIISHNHPSGDTEPSPEDIKITNRLKQAGEIIGITILDHIIIGNDYYSFQSEGKL